MARSGARSGARSDTPSRAPSATGRWLVGACLTLITGCTSAHDPNAKSDNNGLDGGPLQGAADSGRDGAITSLDTRDASTSTDAGVGAAADAAAAVTQCTLNQDCSLIATACCASCLPELKSVRAVPSARAAAERQAACPGQVNCAPCPPPSEHDVPGQLRAACVQGQCVAVDTRSEPSTACTTDGQCEAVAQGCCGVCMGTAKDYFAFRMGADDPHEPECTPVPPCAPCSVQTSAPAVYCAADSHCAVRLVAARDAGVSADAGH